MPCTVSLTVNGEAVELEERALLVDLLRDRLHLRRTHFVHVMAKRAVRAMLAPSA